MLYIVSATIREVEVGLYDNREKTYPVIHPVEAGTPSKAAQMMRDYYAAKSESDDPYGTRYYVQDDDVFETINLATIANIKANRYG